VGFGAAAPPDLTILPGVPDRGRGHAVTAAVLLVIGALVLAGIL